MKTAQRIERAAAIVIALGVLAVTEWRLFYGLNVTDEPFYMAVPYRILRGARIFVDEEAVAQGFVGLLLVPFVALWHGLFGLSGIILAGRHLELVFTLGVALAIAAGLRTVLSGPRAMLVALVAVAFAPFDIHGPSYDVLGCGFLTAGCLLGLRALLRPKDGWAHVAAGLCLGLAVFAYQPLALAVAASVCARLLLGSRRAILTLELPAMALPALALATPILLAGPHTFLHAVHARAAHNGSVLHRLRFVSEHAWYWMPHRMALLAALAGLILLARRLPWTALPLVVALPFLVLSFTRDFWTYRSSSEYIANLAILAVPLYALVQRRAGATALLLSVWLPGAVGGLASGVSSASLGLKIAIGALPAAVASVAFLVLVLEEVLPPRLRTLAVAPVVVVLGWLVAFELPTFLDASIPHLDVTVKSGPFAGIRTTRANRDLLVGLHGDLGEIGSRCRIVFYDFPAGYLLTDAEPYGPSVWPAPKEDVTPFYRDHPLPDVAVVVASRVPGHADPYLNLLRRPPLRVAIHRKAYTVYRRSSTRCRGS